MGVVETRSGGAWRDPEVLGNLGRGIPEVVVHHEDGPLIGREPPKAAIEQVSIADAQEVVGRRRSLDRQHSQVRRPAALAPRSTGWWLGALVVLG